MKKTNYFHVWDIKLLNYYFKDKDFFLDGNFKSKDIKESLKFQSFNFIRE
jgi:hypothetical protein